MGVYGINLENTNEYVISEAEEMTLLEFSMFKSNVKIPAEMQLNVEDIWSASAFIKKTTAIINYIEQNSKNKEKQLAKTIYYFYYAIIGNTFDGKCKRYEPKMGYYLPLAKKYCDDKQISRIKNDINKTIISLEKMDQSKMNSLQKEYLKDLKSNVSKLD